VKVKFFFLIAFLAISVSLFGMHTSTSVNHNWVTYRGSGGPDDYGYTWIDSDETGGPTYNWIDITGIGTEVIGLSDDNNVGPFNIGFDFPYYWYTVNQFWVESNGAISVSDDNVYFPQENNFIPSTIVPNDMIIPLGADLTLESENPDSGQVFYYSNNTDTLIVSFIKVPAWDIGGIVGSHSFQLILTKQDSCIYFEFDEQHGSFYQNTCCTGIEDVIGDVGLLVLYNMQPDSGYAVKFIPPESSSYEALDVGVKETISSGSEGIFVYPGDSYQLWATITNYGNVDATSFDVSCLVKNVGGTNFFGDTITINNLAAGDETTVNFTPNWTPSSMDNYYALVQTSLSGDINPSNNTKDAEMMAIDIPGWLIFDSDPSSGMATYWYGAGGGWGQEFVPPQYPMHIDSIQVTMSSPVNCNVPILFLDDDGLNGSPGTIMHAETVFVQGTGYFDYYSIKIPSGVNTITDGAFYVGMIQVGDSFPRIILEQDGPFSRRAWEFTGSWAPYRGRNESELLIRAYTPDVEGISEFVDSKKTYALSLLPVRSNPVKGKTTIYYALPSDEDISLKIYNILGQEVRTLESGHKKAGPHSVTFDTRDSKGKLLPQGVYFYRLTAGDRSRTRKITLLR
jgi:hypothetical protein